LRAKQIIGYYRGSWGPRTGDGDVENGFCGLVQHVEYYIPGMPGRLHVGDEQIQSAQLDDGLICCLGLCCGWCGGVYGFP
jgi:hypothetical protein